MYATTPSIEWEKYYSEGGHAAAYVVKETRDGGYISAGYHYLTNDSANYDVYLVKTDSEGNKEWSKTYGGNGTEWARDIMEMDDGGFLVIGSTDSYGWGNTDVYAIKTDSNGDMVWNKTYGTSDVEEAYAITKNTEGGYIIVGYKMHGDYETNIWMKIDENGSMKRFAFYLPTADLRYYDIKHTDDGGYIVTGFSTEESSGKDVLLRKLDSSGNTEWSKTFYGPGNDTGNSVIITSDGHYVITGSREQGEYTTVNLIKTDSAGNSTFIKYWLTTGDKEAHSVIETYDGGYLVAGFSQAEDPNYNAYVMRTDINGTKTWDLEIGGNGTEQAFNVIQTDDDGYLVAGHGKNPEADNNLYLVKLESDKQEYGSLEVYVKDSHGLPVEGVIVEASMYPEGQEALLGTTDIHGYILFTDIYIGNYTLIAEKEGYTSSARDLTVETNLITSVAMNMTLITGQLEIIVSDAEGTPIEGAMVDMANIEDQTTDATGLVSFNSVPPGEYTVHVSMSGYVDAQLNVIVAPTETTTESVTLLLETSSIQVTVLDEENSPILEASVTSTVQPAGQDTINIQTDAEGIAEDTGLILGNYIIKVTKTGYIDETALLTLQLTEKQVTIILEAEPPEEPEPRDNILSSPLILGVFLIVILIIVYFLYQNTRK